jgi:hypothetical protein
VEKIGEIWWKKFGGKSLRKFGENLTKKSLTKKSAEKKLIMLNLSYPDSPEKYVASPGFLID